MLRALVRSLKPGARTGFFVIGNARPLGADDRRILAEREGSDHVESPAPYRELMNDAGFTEVEVTDVTPDYLDTLRNWHDQWQSEMPSLVELFGDEEASRRFANRKRDIRHVEEGLLGRYLVIGRRPHSAV